MISRNNLFIGFCVMIIISLAVLAGGCRERLVSPPTNGGEKGAKFFPTTKPSAVAGQQIYTSKCSTCHGVGGAGDGSAASSLSEKPPNFTDLDFMRRESPQEFYKNILNGKEAMPKFNKKLNEQQRWDALFYIWSRATAPMQIKAGKQVYAKHCQACHGEKGDGKGVAAEGLKAKPTNLKDPRFMMKENSDEFFEKVTKGAKPMPAFENKLTAAQRWNVVDYVWTFIYQPANE